MTTWDGALCIDRWLEFDLALIGNDPRRIINAVEVCSQCPIRDACLTHAKATKAKEVIQGGVAWGEDGRRLALPKAKNVHRLLTTDDPRVARSRILLAGECGRGHEINDTADLALNGKQGVRCLHCLHEQRPMKQEQAA